MSCDAPLQGYYAASVNPKTGKRPIQFKAGRSFSGVRMMIPCGKCTGCRLEHSRRWAMRLMHENKMHKSSCFLTLTYNKESLPDIGTLVPDHLQGFHKRLHNRLLSKRGVGIRYYGCGEYGSLSKRPHYHSLVFGYDFDDKKLYSRNSRDEAIYSSELLDEIWGFGECKIGAVTFESAAYVARYCLKKVDGKKRDDGHYLVYDGDGLVHERVPEFSHMSRRPGIGARYFDKYGSEIAQHDNVIVNGRAVPSIRYYDLRLDARRLEELKKVRRGKSVWAERQTDRRRVRERLRNAQLSEKKRLL